MARPRKEGLDYFPLDVDFFSDDKFIRLESLVGGEGVCLAIKLLCEVYAAGYARKLDENARKTLIFKHRVDENFFHEVLENCIWVGLFDGDVLAGQEYLTSKGIQKRFLEVGRKRSKFNKLEGVWLLDSENPPETLPETGERKEKNSKEKNSKEVTERQRIGEYVHFIPSTAKKLIEKHGKDFFSECCKELNGWVGQEAPEPGQRESAEFKKRKRNAYNAAQTFNKWVVDAVTEKRNKRAMKGEGRPQPKVWEGHK